MEAEYSTTPQSNGTRHKTKKWPRISQAIFSKTSAGRSAY